MREKHRNALNFVRTWFYAALNYNMIPVQVVEFVPKKQFGPVFFIIGSVISGIIQFGFAVWFSYFVFFTTRSII